MINLKPRKFEKDKIFFTSDLHFGHRNIMQYDPRPWDTIEAMDEALIENWNSVVPKDGIVFLLGDVSYHPLAKNIEILYRLNGKIYLIPGNHDQARHNGLPLERFEDIQLMMYVKIGDRRVYMSHYPLLTYPHWWDDSSPWNLYGHVHSIPNMDQYVGIDKPRLEYTLPTQYDVGVANNNWAPISFLDIERIITKQIEDDKDNRNIREARANTR